MSISLCMIVKNEEENIKRCLDSVYDIVDEIIIVDTGSTDRTVEIAKKYNAKIYNFEWNNNFSDARNFSLDMASCDWILIMDADDELERKDKDKLILLTKNENVNAYFLQTLSYVGEKPGLDIIMNLNIRLIRNKMGYKFYGAIHEQIKPNDMDKNRKDAIKVENIRFYHYGYINKTVKDKNKRKRNMEIIEKELQREPNNGFMLFNMGSEYYALEDYKKALEYYEESYKSFNPNLGYTPKLLIRMASCYEQLGIYEKELWIIESGLRLYPNFTDLEFLKATTYFKLQKYTLAIKSLNKCIEMGEAPSYLNCLLGVGTFRPYFLLSTIYYLNGDYDEAYKCCIETLKIRPNFMDAFYRIADILFEQKKDSFEIKSTLESFFDGKFDGISYITLCDIFFSKGKYNIALEYILKAEEFTEYEESINYYKGLCLFYQKKFYDAKKCFKIIKSNENFKNSLYYIILCDALTGNIDAALRALKKVEEFDDGNKIVVYKTFLNLILNKKCDIICSDREVSKSYLNPIFELLSVLLKLQRFDEFEKTLEMLNLIESDEVLLLLAKLYYNNGFYKQSYKEFTRSIKIFDKIDAEGLDMMRNALIIINSNSRA
ncbi:glycosyltransferase [Caloramator sp. E03]|uniref:TPR domain-containing glycosyltransferase n=1 Tax=Caloramator sp. E03 TaxID=2576307 RepID=UPI001110F388|nr:TPR domain-containing glycosyltransferase [Caloramator sp. E03]QCX34238.1 glycosyltransferase [Caloramator sp. E03]